MRHVFGCTLHDRAGTCEVEGSQVEALEQPDVAVVVDEAGHGIGVERALVGKSSTCTAVP